MTKASIWDQLHNISGGSTTKTSRSGMSTRSARNAGVTRDVVRPDVQALADSIAPPEDKLTAGEKRTIASLRKYNIAGDTATVSPEVFRELFAKTSGFTTLKNKGVKTIKIQAGDIDMRLELFDAATDDAAKLQNIASLPTRDIVTAGIAQAAGLEKKLVIRNKITIVGILHIDSTDMALAKIGGQGIQGKIHTTEWVGYGNAMAIFQDSTTVGTAAYNFKKAGQLDLTHSFKNNAGQTRAAPIGTLYHPDNLANQNIDLSALRKIQIQHVARAIASSKADNAAQLISDVFKDATKGYVLYSAANYNTEPVAVFIPPKHHFE